MTIPRIGVFDNILAENQIDIEQAALSQDVKFEFFPSLPPDYPIRKTFRDHLSKWAHSEDDDLPAIGDEDYLRILNATFQQLYRLHQLFEHEIPEYSDDIPVFGPFEKGKSFDVLSMLSNGNRDYLVRNNGDRVLVESLKGKYVLICCYFVPIPIEPYPASSCLDMIHMYSQLSLEKPDDFEMVMVAKMRPNWVHNEVAFDHFFSAFPCLTIPFWDSYSREFVCKSLQLGRGGYATLVVDPKQTVLGKHSYELVSSYGASSFPFTEEMFYQLSKEVYEMRLRIDNVDNNNNTPSLEELICLNPSDYLRKCDDNDELVSVLDLNKKLVGLYLCYNGDFLTTLDFIHKKCIAKGLEFEIVLVYLPFAGDIQWFQNRVKVELAKHKISWWVLPFNDKVSRRLSQFSSHDFDDRVMILGPNSSFGDTMGRAVMSHFGIEAYPFTRKFILDKKSAKLRELTLESVLNVSDERNYVVNKDGDRIPMANLLGRNIILYLDYLPTTKGYFSYDLYDMLIDWYPKLKAKDPDFEVVFVGIDEEISEEVDDGQLRVMPWLAIPFRSAQSRCIINRLFFESEGYGWYSTFVAFDKDGRIRTRRAWQYLSLNGIEAFPFDDHLCEDLSSDFNHQYEHY